MDALRIVGELFGGLKLDRAVSPEFARLAAEKAAVVAVNSIGQSEAVVRGRVQVAVLELEQELKK